MPTNASQHLSVVLTPKTCVHCGRDSVTSGRAYACPTCKQLGRAGGNSIPKLSLREQQIVQLIQRAKTNKEIAYDLCLTVGTVKEYVYHVFRKLGVTNRTELALWGRNDNAAGAS
jgi:DNA-binding NarL/FixJ family response regulator